MAFEKGTSIRQAAELIAKKDGFGVRFTCDDNFLKGEVQTGTMTAKGPQELIERLGSETVDPALHHKLQVTRVPDKGIYEIHCE